MEGNNKEVNEINENSNTEVNEIKGEKRNKSLLSIAFLALAGIVVTALAVFVVLSMTSPKNIFFKLVNSTFSSISKGTEKFEDSVFGKLLALDTSSKLGIDAVVSGKVETDDAEIKDWYSGIETFYVEAHENVDFDNNYTDAEAKFSINGENVLTGSVVKNKDIISARLNDVTDGYITVDNSNLTDLWRKIGVNGPSSLDISNNVFKDLNFSKKDINNLKNTISKFASGFASAFDDEDFALGTGIVEYDEGSIECKTADFIVSAIDLNNGLIAGLEEITSKEKYIDSIYKVVSTMDKIYGYDPLTRDAFGTNLSEMLEQIRNLDFSEEDEGFVLRFYYTGNKILKVEMLSEDYNTRMLSFTAVNSKNSAYYKYSDGVSVYEDVATTIDGVTTHMLSVDFIDYETGQILEGYGSDIVIKIDSSKKNEQTVNLTEKVRLVSYDSDIDNLDIMAIEPTEVVNYTLTGSIDGNKKKVLLTMIDGDNSYKSIFSVDATIEESAEFENIVIDDNENFDVTKKTDEEIINEKNDIIQKWNEAVGEVRTEQLRTAISVYLSMFVPSNYDSGSDDVDISSVDLESLELE